MLTTFPPASARAPSRYGARQPSRLMRATALSATNLRRLSTLMAVRLWRGPVIAGCIVQEVIVASFLFRPAAANPRVVEGKNNVEFLRRISGMLDAEDPDSQTWLRWNGKESLIFVPFGGGDSRPMGLSPGRPRGARISPLRSRRAACDRGAATGSRHSQLAAELPGPHHAQTEPGKLSPQRRHIRVQRHPRRILRRRQRRRSCRSARLRQTRRTPALAIAARASTPTSPQQSEAVAQYESPRIA